MLRHVFKKDFFEAKKYSQVRSTSGKTGREVAEEILHSNGIYDVDVVKGEGFLTDHYDPNKKDNKPNMYEEAMRNVGTIMENYAFKKKFAGFGFGGVP